MPYIIIFEKSSLTLLEKDVGIIYDVNIKIYAKYRSLQGFDLKVLVS